MENGLNDVENHLIELLPRADRAGLLKLCIPVPLILSQVICRPGKATTQHVYFPIEGFVSLLAPLKGESALEVGMVGREGMLGVQIVLGVTAIPLTALVQGAGTALRVDAKAFRLQLARSDALKRTLDRYVHVLMSQMVTSATCLRFHLIAPRLARWLLMSQDRAQSDSFPMTHEFLSSMLGVRRVGITSAAVILQRAGLIRYRRGALTVLDRAGLKSAACGCYMKDRSVYSSVLQ